MKDEALKLALEALEAGEDYIDDLEAIVYAANDLGTHEDRAKMQEAITVVKQALAAPVQEREHITDGGQCWCNPDIDYIDPDTGAAVIIHKEPQ